MGISSADRGSVGSVLVKRRFTSSHVVGGFMYIWDRRWPPAPPKIAINSFKLARAAGIPGACRVEPFAALGQWAPRNMEPSRQDAIEDVCQPNTL